MATELPKQYDPHAAQQRWLDWWNQQGYFHSRPDLSRKPYCIVIPPPNVTGALHMGHALNNTLQDVLIRWRRMQGFNALWMPGTDHAGIATQAVVERLIFQQEKKTRYDLGREALVQRIWEWKYKYEARMLGDTAVAVHPKDPRYQHLIGKMVVIPLVNRAIPIIADGELVDMALGTGAVKVTPAHDPNDYRCGLRHKLPMINILNPDGTINENGGPYQGMDRLTAREQVVADMERLGFYDGREDRDIELKHSDRSKLPIEPYR